ncbi:MAG TPA: hypothetical protein VFV19_07780 [Candidatus Polarisedimenticolaceae bacterium]|nr:hypothetical protein [Candidatus Polarisedimenticolaceae bacterium]
MIGPTWDNFYVIVGGAAAALIGVQFVVIALVSGLSTQVTAESIAAFATPSVVHLTGALVLSALMTAPFASPSPRAMTIGLFGIAGIVYAAIVIRRTKRQTVYRPVFEDWLWHTLLPFGSYVLLVIAALVITRGWGAYAVAAVSLGLLLIGIHNAWDSMTHMLVKSRTEP